MLIPVCEHGVSFCVLRVRMGMLLVYNETDVILVEF